MESCRMELIKIVKRLPPMQAEKIFSYVRFLEIEEMFGVNDEDWRPDDEPSEMKLS